MSFGEAEELRMRPGELACVCGPGETESEAFDRQDLWRLAFAFGLSVLAQALTLSALPEVSLALAPTAARLGLPYALLLVGAAIATVPAAYLIDAFGRRSAFALGASLGGAGGLLAAWAAHQGHFAALCLGAFWLGLAQGFSLFYRHIAAGGSSLAARAGMLVLAGGGIAAFGAPLLIWIARHYSEGVGTFFVLAAGLHAAALWLSTRLPHALPAPAAPKPTSTTHLSWRYYIATGAGAVAWFIMAAGMLHGPLSLATCLAPRSFVGAAMAWHLMAMYGPAALAARWPHLAPAPIAIAAGLLAMVAAAAVMRVSPSVGSVTIALLVIGAGWSFVNVGALGLLHDQRRPPRVALALHDMCLLGAAAAGALLS